MPTTTFDPRINIGGTDAFIGKFNNVRVVQGGLPGHLSNLVINRTQPFSIELEWQLDGILFNVNGVLGNIAPPNEWRVDVFAERMGAGADLEIYSGAVPGADVVSSLPATWSHTCDIPANTLPEHIPGSRSGVYKLVVVVFANTSTPGAHDIIGFHEGPVIMSEDPA